MAEIIMPKMGDAMDEGKIVQWLKKVGESVKEGEAVAEIETDKSNVEIEAPTGGILQSITAAAGDVVPVGNVIATLGDTAPVEANASAPAPEAGKTETPKPEPVKQDTTLPAQTNGSSPAPVVERESLPATVPVSVAPSAPFKPYDSFVGGLPENLGGSSSLVGEPIVVVGLAERVKVTPLARAMAQTHNLDLNALRGSGPDGGIVKRDIETALATKTAAPVAPVVAPVSTVAAPAPAASTAPAVVADGDEVQEYNAMRRTIAKRLTESKSTIPHFYVTSEIDVEAMMALREQVNTTSGESQAKITFSDFLIKACAAALIKVPVVNSVFSDNKRILRRSVNIGTAVSIDDGLIVPVVRDCQTKSLRAIATETRPLFEKARTGKLKPEEYTGGTFTISNLGQYDVENFAAIINPGEAAILAVSSVRQIPAVVENQIVPRRRMKVTLCADHRVMDGVAGAQFLQELKRLIENPLLILV